MIPLEAPMGPLPTEATAAAILLVGIVSVVAWLVYLYR